MFVFYIFFSWISRSTVLSVVLFCKTTCGSLPFVKKYERSVLALSLVLYFSPPKHNLTLILSTPKASENHRIMRSAESMLFYKNSESVAPQTSFLLFHYFFSPFFLLFVEIIASVLGNGERER